MNGKEVVNLEAEIHGMSEAEARERFSLDPSADILLRVFCTTRAGRVALLLNAYDKGEATSKKKQQAEIREAIARKKRLDQRDASRTKAARRSSRRAT